MEAGANANICTFLEKMATNVFEQLLSDKLIHLEGWKKADTPPESDVGMAPVLVAADFKATFPTASGALAPRQGEELPPKQEL